MKQLLYTLLLLLGWNSIANAQTQQQDFYCTNPKVHDQLVKLNSELTDKGKNLILMRNMSMPSGGWQPLTTELKSGNYHINFVAEPDAKRITLTILDKDNNTVLKQKAKKSNAIATTFRANYTGTYYIIMSQKVKKKMEVCGGVSIIEK